MNRRKFIITSACALPSISALHSIDPVKTYRSEKSIFSNEELTEWCEKNGGHYAQDDELVYAYYQTHDREYGPKSPNAYKDPYKSFRHLIFHIAPIHDKYEALNWWLVGYRHQYGEYRFIINDIYYPDYVIENIKMMPLIASTREYPNGKSYRSHFPIFDIKSHKYIVPTFEGECGTINFTGFRFI